MRLWLRELRKDKDVSVEIISIKCGIAQSYYSLIETGKRNPSVAVAQKIAMLLDFDWTLFFNNDSNVNIPAEDKEIKERSI